MKAIYFLILLNLLGSCKEPTDKDLIEADEIHAHKNSMNHHKTLVGCGFTSLAEIENNFLAPEDRVLQIVNNIVTYSGLPNNIKVYRDDSIDNAFATIFNGQRIIVYDGKLFYNVESYSSTYWTSVFILAHEIGHHLSGHTEEKLGSTPPAELQADKFAGYVLYKMGASLQDSKKAIEILGSEQDSKTHPSKYKRLKVINEGWTEASKQRYEGALPPAPNDSPNDFYVFTKEMLISREFLYNEDYPEWFRDYKFLYGVVTEVESDYSSCRIKIVNCSKEFTVGFRDIKDEEWTIHFESIDFGADTEMCHACASNFKSVIVPGRRIKFSIVESLPDSGTSLNGVWFLTYAEAMRANSL